MEKRKRRERPASNGTETDHVAGQGDFHNWQREAEQQGVGIASKKVLVSGSRNNDATVVSSCPSQPFVPGMNWSYVSQQCLQQSTQLSSQSSQTQAAQSQTSQQGQQAAPHQGQLPPGQQPTPYWPSADLAGMGAGAGHIYPFPPGRSQDANSSWHTSTFSGAQGGSGNVPSFSYPSGCGFPPAYPGFWDPSSWWAHNAQHIVYPYLFPGYGNGYCFPPLPATPAGGLQRGFIKPPPGLSQKHRLLWEAQSMENMQIWAVLARAEGEISNQHNKIVKLEADLQAIKAQQDAAMEASAAAAAASQPARRVRRRKPAQTPVAILGLPAPESVPIRTHSRRPGYSRAIVAKSDLQKGQGKEHEQEDKDRVTLANLATASFNNLDPHHEKGGSRMEKSGAGIKLENNETSVTLSQCTIAADNNVQCRERENASDNQVDCTKPVMSLEVEIESVCERNIVVRETNIGTFAEDGIFAENRGAAPADVASSYYKGGCTRLNERENCSGASAGDTPRNSTLEAGLQLHYGTRGVERSNALYSGKALASWDRSEDASEEQDEVAASGQDDDNYDDEADDDEETALDEITRSKIDNLMSLESVSGPTLPKQMTALNRW